MACIVTNVPLNLEYYLEDEYRWCKLEIIKSVMGRLEESVKITSLSQLPETFHARYLNVRIKPGSVHDVINYSEEEVQDKA